MPAKWTWKLLLLVAELCSGISFPLRPMLPFKVVYSDAYYLPIGTHIFPAEKYRLVARCLREKGIAMDEDFIVPQSAEDREVLLAHGDFYVHKLRTGTLSAREELQMEIPYSDELVDAFWLNAGGSILAARQSLRDGVCVSLGGGFHPPCRCPGEHRNLRPWRVRSASRAAVRE